jgi:hypothetical protein
LGREGKILGRCPEKIKSLVQVFGSLPLILEIVVLWRIEIGNITIQTCFADMAGVTGFFRFFL